MPASASSNNKACITVQGLAALVNTEKNTVIANVLGVDQSTASRYRSGEVGLKAAQVDRLLDALGYKIVPAGAEVVARDELVFMRKAAANWLLRET